MKLTVGMMLEPWLDPRIIIKESGIEGRGMFASAPIKAGEKILRWGGIVVSAEELKSGKFKSETAAIIEDGIYLVDMSDNVTAAADYCLNHSCDPNLWMEDEITLGARRDISPGEELTSDYALWETNPLWKLFPCCCGSNNCRSKITGGDWQLTELRGRYRGHFIPYLNRKIKHAIDCR